MSLFGRGEPTTTGEEQRVGDEPSFATAGFLDNSPGTTRGDGGGDNGGSGDGFDPSIHIGRDKVNADGSFTKKRGRKSGDGSNNSSSRGKPKAKLQASVDGLTNILTVLHVGISKATNTPEVAIDRDDAEMLAKATAEVLSEFDIQPDPKIQAIIGLITAAGMVYGPMAMNIKLRKDAEKKKAIT